MCYIYSAEYNADGVTFGESHCFYTDNSGLQSRPEFGFASHVCTCPSVLLCHLTLNEGQMKEREREGGG